ncbi:hypothetical protein LJC68_06095 [Bacteroidales bacterium OttesenSCG-928-B11]|nr:hypothetical protein [Bacteroidales bacterium OttesenSCG-928-B11]
MKEHVKEVLDALEVIYLQTNEEPYNGSFYAITKPFIAKKNLAVCVFQYLLNHKILSWSGNKRFPQYQWAKERTSPNTDLAENIVAHFNADTYKSSVVTNQQKQEETDRQKQMEKENAYTKGVKDTLSKLSEMQELFFPLGFRIEVRRIK